MPRPDWIEVGRVRRSHGLKGEVLVTVDSDNPDRFRPGSVVYGRPRKEPPGGSSWAVENPTGRRQLTMTSVREGNRDSLIVHFAGIEDRNAADVLRGLVLEIPASDLPELEEGEFYPFDLEGLEVKDQEGTPLGTVLELFDTPAQSVLRIRLASGSETTTPFLMESVPTVDVAGGFLVVASGFLEEPET